MIVNAIRADIKSIVTVKIFGPESGPAASVTPMTPFFRTKPYFYHKFEHMVIFR